MGRTGAALTEVLFDAILARGRPMGRGSGPFSLEDGRTNDWNGRRGVCLKEANGHVLELLTVE